MSRFWSFIFYYGGIGVSACVGLLVAYYWMLRQSSSLGFLFFHNSPAYIFWYVTLTISSGILFGLHVALFVYQWRRYGWPQFKQLGSSSGGALIGMLASVCPICGTTFIAGIGIIGSLSVLPLRGLEIKALAVGLLLAAVIWASRRVSLMLCSPAHCPRPRKTAWSQTDYFVLAVLIIVLGVLGTTGWRLSRSDPFFSHDPSLQSMLYQCHSSIPTL